MRGIPSPVVELRRKVFTQVARMSYEGSNGTDYENLMREAPFRIVPGEHGVHQQNIFLERAIVSERVRLAMGLPLRPLDQQVGTAEGIDHAAISDKYYDPPLVNIIKFACNACPEKLVMVSSLCQGCLAHPCQQVCPKKCISFRNGKSYIDQSACIKCGRCVDACPYNAIVKTERPCAKACGMDAIHSDELGRADIDYSRCVSCGMCLVNCPFGAIADKGQIFQLIQSLKKGDRVYALVAPSFVSQFPGIQTTAKLRAALQQLGFEDVVEIGVGADMTTVDEARSFLAEVPSERKFMATSCCPSWSMMGKTLFPELAPNISMAMTPMVFCARMMKKADPEARMCFVGPCSAKKLEASRRSVRSDVDFVVTFEELAGMFDAKQIDFAALDEAEGEDTMVYATSSGRGYAVSGGVAQAVADQIRKWHPEMEVKIASAQGLAECRRLLQMAKAGKYDGFLLEGMGCPGGCVGGAGTLADPARATVALKKYAANAPLDDPESSSFISNLHFLKEDVPE